LKWLILYFCLVHVSPEQFAGKTPRSLPRGNTPIIGIAFAICGFLMFGSSIREKYMKTKSEIDLGSFEGVSVGQQAASEIKPTIESIKNTAETATTAAQTKLPAVTKP
jgi:hypothetical protein